METFSKECYNLEICDCRLENFIFNSTCEELRRSLYMLPRGGIARVPICVFRRVSETCDRRGGVRLLFRISQTRGQSLATGEKGYETRY